MKFESETNWRHRLRHCPGGSSTAAWGTPGHSVSDSMSRPLPSAVLLRRPPSRLLAMEPIPEVREVRSCGFHVQQG